VFKARTADLVALSTAGEPAAAGAIYRRVLVALLERIDRSTRLARGEEALELNLLRVSISSVRTRFELVTR
jgi:hypothetical protein